jgi:PAT family beta-lactamase induction signal transducer AmpG
LVSKQFTATQYALLTSFMMLPGKIFSGFSGILADYFQSISGADYGWMLFFIFTSMLAIPAIILISLNKSLIQR